MLSPTSRHYAHHLSAQAGGEACVFLSQLDIRVALLFQECIEDLFIVYNGFFLCPLFQLRRRRTEQSYARRAGAEDPRREELDCYATPGYAEILQAKGITPALVDIFQPGATEKITAAARAAADAGGGFVAEGSAAEGSMSIHQTTHPFFLFFFVWGSRGERDRGEGDRFLSVLFLLLPSLPPPSPPSLRC